MERKRESEKVGKEREGARGRGDREKTKQRESQTKKFKEALRQEKARRGVCVSLNFFSLHWIFTSWSKAGKYWVPYIGTLTLCYMFFNTDSSMKYTIISRNLQCGWRTHTRNNSGLVIVLTNSNKNMEMDLFTWLVTMAFWWTMQHLFSFLTLFNTQW